MYVIVWPDFMRSIIIIIIIIIIIYKYSVVVNINNEVGIYCTRVPIHVSVNRRSLPGQDRTGQDGDFRRGTKPTHALSI